MHELLYPLLQGTDSVAIRADIELGGNDQKFNNLMGRQLQEADGQAPQVVVLSHLLLGTDGKEKMSQSLGNYISVIDTPNDMFGKTMSIPDDLILNWFERATDFPMDAARALLAPGENPRNAKVRLAKEIVTLYHSAEAADAAEAYFVETFSKRNEPVEAESVALPDGLLEDGFVSVPALVVALGLAKSNGAVKDLIKAGGVGLDGEKVTELRIPDPRGKTLRVGKINFRRLI
jgi:tyrosyl-tRNA synthetase